ncbi:MAG: PAS domain S-box protein, partial [Rhodothermales bacterium]
MSSIRHTRVSQAPPRSLHVLILEDNPAHAMLMECELANAGFDVCAQRVETKADFQAHLTPAVDIILADYNLPRFNALEAFAWLKECRLDIPYIIVSGSIREEDAVEAVKQGVSDYLLKDRLSRLGSAVERALEDRRLRREKQRVDQELRGSEEKFRSIFNGVSSGIVLGAVSDGRIVETNAALQWMLGYSPEALQQMTFYDITHTEDVGTSRDLFKQLLEGSLDRYQQDKRYVRSDGSVLWGRTTVSLMHDSEGRPEYSLDIIEDITERKKAEDALQESEARMRAILDAAINAIITMDDQGRIESFNRAAEVMFGYDAREVVGASLTQLMPEEYRKAHEQGMNRYLETKVPQIIGGHVEVKGLRKDGTVFPMELAVSRVRLGDQVLFTGIARDISKSKQAEEALLESQERFELAVRGSNDGLWDWPDVTKEAQWWSSRWYELLGYEDGEVEASYSNFGDFLHPDDREKVAEYVGVHFEDRVPIDMEYRLRTKSGAYRWFRGRAQALWDENGNPFRMSGSIQDITERKQAEEQLRLKSSALEATAAGIVITDHRGTILWVNKAFTELTGYTKEEALGQNPRLLRSGEQDPTYYEELWQTVLAGDVWRGELINRRKDGSTYIEEMTITPVRGAGEQITHFIAVKQNITDRKQAQEDLEKYNYELEITKSIFEDQASQLAEIVHELEVAKDRAETATRQWKEATEQLQANQAHLVQSEKMVSLGQLAAGVAHEINNPIGFVMSNLGTLTEYTEIFLRLLQESTTLIERLSPDHQAPYSDIIDRVRTIEEEEDLAFIREDVDALLAESLNGMHRVKDIVQGLKSFARLDEAEMQIADVTDCIEATLKVVWNEL